MPELTYRSPGVSTREIDLSGPSITNPVGVPAGVIGTAQEGPAFVPITLGNYTDFVATFGSSDGEKFGPLAVNEWLKSAGSCTYVRVLGVGNGKKRDSSTGRVTNAGFIVGANAPMENGNVASAGGGNPYANAGADGTSLPGALPPTFFLGCFMSESNGSTIFSSAGIQKTEETSGKTATAVNAIDTDGAYAGINGGTDVQFTISVPTSAGGEAGIVTIILTDADDTGAAGATANTIGIGGLSGLGDASWQNLVLAAINNDTSSGRITMATSGRGTAGITGVTATNGTSTTQTTLTIDQAGGAGNNAVLASTAGVDIIDVTSFTGGMSENQAVPILRGILMAPSGVWLAMSGAGVTAANTAPASTAIGNRNDTSFRGTTTGTLDLVNNEFVVFLNGFIGKNSEPRAITASFDPASPNYLSKVFNSDPYQIAKKGNYLYSHYDIHPALAVVTGTGVVQTYEGGTKANVAFITSGSAGRDTGTSTAPNYDNYQDRFRTAFSPFVISQNFGGQPYSLFKIHAISDGAVATNRYKLSIENINKAPDNSSTEYGSFDVVVRQFNDSDETPIVLEAYRGVSLDRDSDRFIGRAIGDQRSYFDFDQATGAQKLLVQGSHPNRSRRIRIEQSVALKNGAVPNTTLPMGFRGPYHLITSGGTIAGHGGSTGPIAGPDSPGSDAGRGFVSASSGPWQSLTEPGIPMRESVALGLTPTKRASAQFFWGTQTDLKESVTEPNKLARFDKTFYSYAKFFPRFEGTSLDVSVGDNPGKAVLNGIVLDCDKFNYNKFSLEKVMVRTGSDELADPLEWVSASYYRKDAISPNASNKTRAFKVNDLKHSANRNYAKFTFFLQGGFDGTNIFNKAKNNITNPAAVREMNDATTQGGREGPTVASFRKAIDIMGNTSDVSIKLLTVPGMRETGITGYAIDAVESRFDALYIMDIEERDTYNTVITSSLSRAHVGNTVTDFQNRALDTSFAAAYFPDAVIQDPATRSNLAVPPSVVVLGAFALNDSVGHPWFAPAGFTRGALTTTIQSKVELNRSNLDSLYDADINPLTSFPGTGVVVFGQKTLLATASALDRVNVRRLLIEIRRSVRSVANTLLFEPNRQSTLDKFSALVNPILQSIQEQSGVDRYKVVIDTTTTTQADVENNTIRGKIFLQPTRSVEFISLDFELKNAGVEI